MGRIHTHIASPARRISFSLIDEAKRSGKQLQSVISNALRTENGLANTQSALITEIVYGYFRYAIRLHSLLDMNIRKIKKIPEDMVQLLECALYELLYMESSQDSAVIFNVVESVKKTYGVQLASLSNAVLRKIARNKSDYISYACYGNEESDELYAQHYSLPLWIWKKLRGYYGSGAEEYASFFLKRPLIATEYNRSAMALLEAFTVDTWEGSIWDCCCGRGGKSHLLQAYSKNVTVMSDIYIKRLRHAENMNIARLCVDASRPAFKENIFDIVVADVPCSGFGTLMKRPDIKIKRKEEDIITLREIQKEIVNAVEPTIKRGGYLVYITCTWNKEENEEQVQAFMNKHTGYSLLQEYNSPLEYNDILYGAVLQKR